MEFNKYNYLITKIQGYRNEDYIPCPYPDCPEFAQESQFSTNIVICQNGHTFCKKCLELIDKNIKDIKEKEHTCFENMTLEEDKSFVAVQCWESDNHYEDSFEDVRRTNASEEELVLHFL